MKKVYYAHVISIYDTPQEDRDVQMLHDLGFKVVNPNSAITQISYDSMNGTYTNSFIVFENLIDDCEIFAFRALPDGSISSGVHKELLYASSKGIPIIELPTLLCRKVLTIDETRDYLKLVGKR